MPHGQEREQSIEVNPKVMQMLELSERVFKELKNHVKRFSREKNEKHAWRDEKFQQRDTNIKKNQMEVLEMKNAMFRMKTLFYGLNNKLDFKKGEGASLNWKSTVFIWTETQIGK